MTQKNLPDRISSDFADKFRNQYEDFLDHEITRNKINKVIQEYVDKVEFMEKVRKYAGQEIETRLFVNFKYWLATAGTALVVSLISIFVPKLFK